MISLAELMQRLLAGQLLIVGEVRAADAREAGFVCKKSGLAEKTLIVTYFVERWTSWGYEIVKINRRAPITIGDPPPVPPVEMRGRTYAFEIKSVERKPGLVTAWMADRDPEEVEKDEGAAGSAPSGAGGAVP